ncbi:hypothetical protein BN1723_003428 [Verticillium longisporum]|uniref:Uncharacterized protein n=1 Tax=Verticillium longisporum TaxID=100787 RepID=A0A0G4LYZ4_VERLO|nr:hypothetical protein BN1723_003428 [Verticillium longisporum]
MIHSQQPSRETAGRLAPLHRLRRTTGAGQAAVTFLDITHLRCKPPFPLPVLRDKDVVASFACQPLALCLGGSNLADKDEDEEEAEAEEDAGPGAGNEDDEEEGIEGAKSSSSSTRSRSIARRMEATESLLPELARRRATLR